MQFMDPLGIGQGGNLPKIAEAFRSTGTVCVERTLRILNKSKMSNSNQMGGVESSQEDIPDQVMKSFGKTF